MRDSRDATVYMASPVRVMCWKFERKREKAARSQVTGPPDTAILPSYRVGISVGNGASESNPSGHEGLYVNDRD